MAWIRLTGRHGKIVSPEVGLAVYRVLKGLDEPSDEAMERLCSEAENVYLNWRNAPDYYLIERKNILISMVMGHWMRDKSGHPTRPEFSDKDCWRVSKILGLLEHGKRTTLADMYL